MGKGRLEAFSDGVIAIIRDRKGKLSPLVSLVAIASCFVVPWLALCVAAALVWLVAERRIEHELERKAT